MTLKPSAVTSQTVSKLTYLRLTGRDRRRDSLMAKMIGVALLSLVPGLLLAALIEWGSSTSHAEAGLLITAGVCARAGLAAVFGQPGARGFRG